MSATTRAIRERERAIARARADLARLGTPPSARRTELLRELAALEGARALAEARSIALPADGRTLSVATGHVVPHYPPVGTLTGTARPAWREPRP